MNTTTQTHKATCIFGTIAEVHRYKAHRDGRTRALVTTHEDPERRYWIIAAEITA